MIFEVLFYLITAAYIVRTLRMTFYYVFLWQLREYRLDRMLAHIRTPIGRKLIIGRTEQIKWLSFLLFIFALPLIYAVWLIEAGLYIREAFVRGWHVPRMTLKAVVICILTLFVGLLPLLTGTFAGVLLVGPFVDRLLAYFVWLFVDTGNIPSSIWRRWIFMRARKKRMRLKQLTVIGITGSYGKTSTKEYLAALLQEKFRIVKTPESKNADIGIAQWFLSAVPQNTEIAIVEMGILRKGELCRICEMVHPDIGVITGIGDQHIELFGSQEGIVQAKYELIESLPRDGGVIVNGNNDDCRTMAAWAKRDGIKTIIISNTNQHSHISEFRNHCIFSFRFGKKTISLRANVLGRKAVENVILAIHVAHYFGLTAEQIRRGVSRIRPVEQTMKPHIQTSGVTYVDDTFNASTSGVAAGIDYLRQYPGKRVLILTPLIELGDKSAEAHRQLGKLAAETCDSVWLTNPNYYQEVRAGAASVEKATVAVGLVHPAKIIRQLRDIRGKNDVILFEGKEAGKILKDLLSS